MRILLTNDDGIHSAGIQALATCLRAEHTVYVIAPDRERSTVAHALTLHKPLRADPVRSIRGVTAWKVSGTPSDCVKVGLSKLLQTPIDFVISGINGGPNLGLDILYSGTVAGAMEGCFYGFPTLAVSVVARPVKRQHFRSAAQVVAKLLPRLASIKLPPFTFLNMNIPVVANGKKHPKKIEVTKLSTYRYEDIIEERKDLAGRSYFWLAGEDRRSVPLEAGTDVEAVRQGHISITPVQYHLTHEPFRRKLRFLSSLKI